MCTCLQNSRGVTKKKKQQRGAGKVEGEGGGRSGGRGELIKVKVTKGCKHARNRESPPVCVVKHTEGNGGPAETF